jgi:hypothetical protein
MTDEEWRFEAWRKCPTCGGSGRKEETLPWTGMGTSRALECPTCHKLDDQFRRPGFQRKTFTLVELAAELRNLLG